MAVSFYSEGTTPRQRDTMHRIEQKILGALLDGTGGGTGLSGAGSPEGSVTANVGTTYYRTSDGSFWVKDSGTGNTGWVALIV